MALPVPVPNIAAWPLGWGIQLRSRATPAARRPRSKAVPSRRIRGDTSLRVAKARGLCDSLLDAAGLCARRMARSLRSRKANTNCIMTDHRVLRPARLQIK